MPGVVDRYEADNASMAVCLMPVVDLGRGPEGGCHGAAPGRPCIGPSVAVWCHNDSPALPGQRFRRPLRETGAGLPLPWLQQCLTSAARLASIRASFGWVTAKTERKRSASPSSSGLGHRPFTAVTGVRVP